MSRLLLDVQELGVNFERTSWPRRSVLRAAHQVSFSVKPGEVVALCGPSGGGKSSCISLIEGLYRPEAGEVLLDDVNVLDLDRRWFHRQVGLVAQEPVLFARSIRSNIVYGLEDAPPSEEEIVRAAQLANAHSFVSSFEMGYDTFVGERGARPSLRAERRGGVYRI